MRSAHATATIIAILLSVAVPRTQDPAPKSGARIGGRVVAAETGRPLVGASVMTMSWESDRLVKSATTDLLGRFNFAGLPAGRYELAVEAQGYVSYMFGKPLGGESLPPIDLADGEKFDRAEVVMYRTSAIEGTLLDEFGDPAPEVLVQASQLDFVGGQRRMVPVGGRLTDDRGHFRVYGLAPGQYMLTALSGPFAQNRGPAGFAPTYFPGSADVGEAQSIDLKRSETRAVAFSMVAGRDVSVQGAVVGSRGFPVSGAVVELWIRDALGSVGSLSAHVGSGADGRFTFRNVSPGSYLIRARDTSAFQPDGGRGELGRLALTLGGDSLSGLVVRTSRLVSARGRVRFEDGPIPPVPLSQVQIGVRPVELDWDPSSGPSLRPVREDGTFEIPNLSGRGLIRPDIASSDWTLREVRLNGTEVSDVPLEFKDRDVEGIEVVLTTRNASVAGAVLDERGRPTAHFSVVVFASDTKRWDFPSRFVAHARPNQQGRYRITGLPPEEYLITAVPPIADDDWQDPEILERLRSLAQWITLAEGDAKTVDLRIRR